MSRMPTVWLTLDECAERIGKSRRTLRVWVQNGELKPMLGRVRESDLLATEKRMRERMHRGRPKKLS